MSRSRALVATSIALVISGLTVQSRSVVLIGAAEQGLIQGGSSTGPQWCIRTNTTCPDNTYTSSCVYNATLQQCIMCAMNVPSWKDCGTTTDQTMQYNCSMTCKGTDPYCGTTAYDAFGSTSCKGTNGQSLCTTVGGSCGSQICTTTGVPCP